MESKKDYSPRRIAVDLINTLSTIYALLHGHPVFRCTDGFLRDILSSKFKVREMKEELMELIPVLDDLLGKLNVEEAILVIDKPIPWSRRIASNILEMQWKRRVKVEVGMADTLLIKYGLNGYSVATSDIVVLEKTEKTVDLPALLAEDLWGGLPRQCSIAGIIDSWYTRTCSERDRFIRSNTST